MGFHEMSCFTGKIVVRKMTHETGYHDIRFHGKIVVRSMDSRLFVMRSAVSREICRENWSQWLMLVVLLTIN